MREIVDAVGLSVTLVFRILANVRAAGDVRVMRKRRMPREVRRDLVVGLLRCGEPVTPERIALVLWDDAVPGSWRIIIRILIMELRKEGVAVKWTKAGYVLG